MKGTTTRVFIGLVLLACAAMSAKVVANNGSPPPSQKESAEVHKEKESVDAIVAKCVKQRLPLHECFNRLYGHQAVKADFSGLYDSVYVNDPDITSVWVRPPSDLMTRNTD